MSNAWKRMGGAIALSMVAVFAAACGDDGSSSSSPSVDLSVLGKANPATGSPVKVGLFNVEGGSSVSLPEVGDASQAAVDYANGHLGGLDGHKIEVVRCGDKADGASSAACANEFVREGVVAVVSGLSATADQAVPVLQGAGIPWISMSASAPTELADDNAFFFGSGFVGTLAAQAVYSADQGWKTVTLIGTENPQVVSAVNSIGKKLFEDHGVKLNLVTVPSGTPDASSQVAAALHTNPDALDIIGEAPLCQTILSAASNAGASQAKMLISTCVTDEVKAAVGESAIEGAVVFDNYVATGDSEEAKLYQAVMKQYAPDTSTAGLTPNGYRTMLGFIRGVDAGEIKTGNVTPAAISQTLRGAVDVPLPIGLGATFSCDKTQFPLEGVKGTFCTSKQFTTTYSAKGPGSPRVVDAAGALSR
ncbi:branched-chain amino acid transport system substrate-binding protein [Nocardia kruczakiae]|uniref:Branched-chain amino acid transport system substrate-binding protein n=1 Tax=Nocardia kruczakiae TaxID=261477 RepID=A0ABU1X9Z9_9NOCA|nr:ABC transporter substrate-binding protein [Nocardia kruczakiae]MDR7167361.1 branched-chain amino acid transport system substrate-binding protein [Nocardia kruczakiae]